MSIDVSVIPVRVIALKEEKFNVAKREIAKVADFQDVQLWQGVRGSELFDENCFLLPNYHEILAKKYPHVSLDSLKKVNLLSTQTELSLTSGTRTNIYDLHNAGAVGCALSHISVWQHMVTNNMPIMIVFEDDVCFEDRYVKTQSFLEELDEILKEISLDFDVLNLNLCVIPPPLVHATKLRKTRLKNVELVDGIAFRAQGYVITLQGAKTLLKGAFPLLHTIDIYMTILTVLPTTKTHFIYLAMKKPCLKHPLMEFGKKSSIGYGFFSTLVDGLLFLPRELIFAVVGICILSVIAAIVVTVRLCKTTRKKLILEKELLENGNVVFEKRLISSSTRKK